MDFGENSSIAFVGHNINANACNNALYIGLHHTACTDEIGKVIPEPADEAGIVFHDAISDAGAFDAQNVQFLLKDPNSVYEWAPSSNAAAVANGLKVAINTYVARVTIDGVTFVGTVVIGGDGLAYTDLAGEKKVVTLYEVLTCYSPVDDYVEEVKVMCRKNDDGSMCSK
jgi:hypothetical protein